MAGFPLFALKYVGKLVNLILIELIYTFWFYFIWPINAVALTANWVIEDQSENNHWS